LDGIDAQVRALDPVRTLARGWSITRTADGRVVRSTTDVAAGDEVVTTLAAGRVTSTVTATERPVDTATDADTTADSRSPSSSPSPQDPHDSPES
jgi:exodeoxyribonuclease VII large subunit